MKLVEYEAKKTRFDEFIQNIVVLIFVIAFLVGVVLVLSYFGAIPSDR